MSSGGVHSEDGKAIEGINSSEMMSDTVSSFSAPRIINAGRTY